jgi:hypothetical protein
VKAFNPLLSRPWAQEPGLTSSEIVTLVAALTQVMANRANPAADTCSAHTAGSLSTAGLSRAARPSVVEELLQLQKAALQDQCECQFDVSSSSDDETPPGEDRPGNISSNTNTSSAESSEHGQQQLRPQAHDAELKQQSNAEQAKQDLQEPAASFTIFTVGGKAWLHDCLIRMDGKTWKNVILTQYLLVPPTVTLCCSIFVCDPQDNNGNIDRRISTHYLRADYSVVCWTEEHRLLQVIASFGLLVYALCIPAFWSRSLYCLRDHLKAFKTFQRFGFLYLCYRSRSESVIAYQWDIVDTVRKLVLGSIVIFVAPGSLLQLGFFFVVCLFMLCTHLYVQPFKSRLDNHLQTNALFAIVITVFFAVFQRSQAAAAQSGGGTGGTSGGAFMDRRDDSTRIIGFVVLGINILVLVVTVLSFVLMTHKIRTLVPKMVRAVRSSVLVRGDTAISR